MSQLKLVPFADSLRATWRQLLNRKYKSFQYVEVNASDNKIETFRHYEISIVSHKLPLSGILVAH